METKDEYIVISKTEIEKRIKKLDKVYVETTNERFKLNRKLINELSEILSKSTPLTPIIEKTWESCSKLRSGQNIGVNSKSDYISNLKLDI